VRCVTDADCPTGKTCIDRLTYEENLVDPNGGWVDPTGTGLGAQALADCRAAQAEAVILHDLISLIPGTDIDPSNNNEVQLKRGEERVDNIAPGNTVLNVGRVRIRKDTKWRLVGEPGQEDNTNLVLHVDRPFKIKWWAEIVLENLRPDRVLFNLQSDVIARGWRNSTLPGTLLGPRRRIKIGYFTRAEGAVIGARVRLHRDGELTHRPFIGLLDTDVSVNKTSSVTLPGVVAGTDYDDPNTPVTYTLTVSNEGPSNAHGVVLTDVLDAGLNYITGSVSTDPAGLRCEEPGSGGGGTLTCYLDTLARAADLDNPTRVVVTFSAHVDPTERGSITNNGSVTIEEPGDYNGANDSDSVTDLVLAEADLRVASNGHTLSPAVEYPDAVAGQDTVSYSFTTTNDGPSDATSVVLNAPIPSGLTLVGSSIQHSPAGPGISCGPNGNAVRCTVARLVPVGDEALHPGISTFTVTFDATVNCNATGNSASVVRNVTATVSATETDPDGSDDSATEGVNVIEIADLGISKSDNPDPVIAGAGLTYTVTVTNTQPGASDSRNISVNDTLDSGVTLSGNASVSFTDSRSAGSCSNEDCTITRLACGDVATITIAPTVDCDTRTSVTNDVSLTSATSQGPDALPNSASEDTTVNTSVNLGITKSDSPDPVVEGNNLTYQITATNTGGTSSALNAQITDTLPAGLTFNAGLSDPLCSASGQDVTCDIGTLVCVTGSKTLNIVATVGTATNGVDPELSNTATVTSDEDGTGATSAPVTTNIVKINGGTCVDGDADCSSDNCVDGLCCNTSCGGTCEACSNALTGQPNGTCAAIPANSDPDADCPVCDVCDGNGGAGGGACVTAADGTDPASDCDPNGACQSGACECSFGYYGDGFSCTACTVCPVGEGASSACTATTNTVCAPCSGGDGGTYSNVADFLNDCAACSTTCPSGEGQSVACTASADRTCAACDGNCDGTNDWNDGTNLYCQARSTCPVGQGQTAACDASHDTTCADCTGGDGGTYSNVNDNTACQACSTTCGAGTGQSVACTASADRVCGTACCNGLNDYNDGTFLSCQLCGGATTCSPTPNGTQCI
jgi:uncharacterized repeat protein (TIGR01451 family)/fimbrial isopeptide formation D2 family protein